MVMQLKQALIRKKEVLRRTGFSNATLYNKLKDNDFCKPVKIGSRSIAFVEAEVDAWIDQRIQDRDQQPKLLPKGGN